MSRSQPAMRTHDDQPVSVLVAARRSATRSALQSLLEREPGLAPVATASDLTAAVRVLRASSPGVVVIESGLLDPMGVDRLPMLAAAAPNAAFVVTGMGDHPGFAARARAAGAAEYVRLDQAAERLAQAALTAARPGSTP